MTYRAEIDGLRALAVLPVILFHAGFEWFSGGFVGVDVFFVISGYLITTILIEDIENNRFSIVGFYERRARRILPALFFVMLVCVPFAWLWMMPSQMKDFSQSLVAVSLFVSNILFWRESGYFDAAAEEKPLLHTWSLAVEEQYYILFPIFLMLAWRFGKNRVFWMIVVMAAISLLLSEWGWRNEATANFYLAPTRAWELFAGSIAAFIVQKRGVQKNGMLAAIGLLAIIFSIFAYDKLTPFPSVYALAPVLGVMLIVLYAEKDTITARLLSNKLFVGIGLISYSAYLWHQPLFAFARIRMLEHPSLLLMSALSLISLLIAYFSWRYIEKPFRNKDYITRKEVFKYSIFGIAAFSILGLSSLDATVSKLKFSDKFIDSMKYQTHWKGWESCALQIPSITNGGCKIIDVRNAPELLVIGDSHAGHLAAGFFNLAHDYEMNVAMMTRAGCFPGIDNNENYLVKCQSDFIRFALDYAAREESIKAVVLSGYANSKVYGGRLVDGKTTLNEPERISLLANGLHNAVQKMLNVNKRVYIISDNPEMPTKFPGKCVYFKTCDSLKVGKEEFLTRTSHVLDIIEDISNKSELVIPLYSHDILCDQDYCYSYIDDELLYQSDDHFTPEGGQLIIRRLFTASIVNNIKDHQ